MNTKHKKQSHQFQKEKVNQEALGENSEKIAECEASLNMLKYLVESAS